MPVGLLTYHAALTIITPENPNDQGKFTIQGRGGTDLRPPFEWVDKQRQAGENVDALIYMTDGYGPLPVRGVGYPVVWVMTKEGNLRPAFGQVIEIVEDKNQGLINNRWQCG